MRTRVLYDDKAQEGGGALGPTVKQLEGEIAKLREYLNEAKSLSGKERDELRKEIADLRAQLAEAKKEKEPAPEKKPTDPSPFWCRGVEKKKEEKK